MIILRNLTSTRHIRIVSRFPSLRYFSLQTYDSEGLPVAGRTDHDLKPINGTENTLYVISLVITHTTYDHSILT